MAHGDMELRGINAPRSRYYAQGQFGRLFPGLSPFAPDTPAIRALLLEVGKQGGVMDPGAVAANNPDNPANLSSGFTFLGQFIDHDITFDPTSSLERQNDPEAIQNFRTPLLELDNVYGQGPAVSPHLYRSPAGDPTAPAKFLIEKLDPTDPNSHDDVPRNSQNTALLGDPRNDENVILSQLHLAFLKFHNAVVDDLLAQNSIPRGQIFEEAQRRVRWHFQWIIVNEYLPKTVGPDVVQQVLNLPGDARLFKWRHEPFMPVEFSVAAFRFGHSQVRPGYALNDGFGAGFFSDAAVQAPNSPDDPADLRGGKRAKRRFVDFNRFFKIPGSTTTQIGKKFDTKLSPPLFAMPTGAPGLQLAPPVSLAQRNLLRGLVFGLPSGQSMATSLGIPPLTPTELGDLPQELRQSTPPWFYILREGDVRSNGERLGPLGGRIVAEVLLGLMLGDRLSYLRANPAWKPIYGRNGEFTIGDLLKFAGVVTF